jgi:hypothetical protein
VEECYALSLILASHLVASMHSHVFKLQSNVDKWTRRSCSLQDFIDDHFPAASRAAEALHDLQPREDPRLLLTFRLVSMCSRETAGVNTSQDEIDFEFLGKNKTIVQVCCFFPPLVDLSAYPSCLRSASP